MLKCYKLLLLTISTAVLATCWTACDDIDSNSDNFDRTALLQNMADNIIIPAFADLYESTTQLQTEVAAFTESPTLEKLAAAQQAWEVAYIHWQYANAFNFGPAGEEGLRKGLIEEIGIFPVSESKINAILSTGTYNLSDFNRDARGFLAVEFLIYDLNDNNQTVVDTFSDSIRKQYLNDLIANIKSRIAEVNTAWNGEYKETFIRNNGTSVGSSTSQLYNEFVRSYEAIKNFKIELPLGKSPGQTQTAPHLAEAYYSGKSVKMFNAHLLAIENIWYGRKKDGTDGIGFEEYLANVTGGDALIVATKSQLQIVKASMAAIPETPRFSIQIDTNPTPLENFGIELQKNTRYFKGDMSSRLGIAITFDSSDGD